MRKKKNEAIRKRIIDSHRSYAEIADAIGVSEGTVFRWLRHELTLEQRSKIESAFDALGVA